MARTEEQWQRKNERKRIRRKELAAERAALEAYKKQRKQLLHRKDYLLSLGQDASKVFQELEDQHRNKTSIIADHYDRIMNDNNNSIHEETPRPIETPADQLVVHSRGRSRGSGTPLSEAQKAQLVEDRQQQRKLAFVVGNGLENNSDRLLQNSHYLMEVYRNEYAREDELACLLGGEEPGRGMSPSRLAFAGASPAGLPLLDGASASVSSSPALVHSPMRGSSASAASSPACVRRPTSGSASLAMPPAGLLPTTTSGRPPKAPTSAKRSAATPAKRSASSRKRTPASKRSASAAKTPASKRSASSKGSTPSCRKKRKTGPIYRFDPAELVSYLLRNTFKFGDVPTNKQLFVTHPDAPVVDYHQSLNYGHLADALEDLLNCYSECNVFLVKDVESVSIGSSFMSFEVLYALIVAKNEMPPPFVCLTKDSNGNAPIYPFSKYCLAWADLDCATGNESAVSFSNKYPGRVKMLNYTGRMMRNPTEAEVADWTRAKLLDCRTTKYPERDSKDRIIVPVTVSSTVRDVAFSTTFTTGNIGTNEVIDDIEDLIQQKRNDANFELSDEERDSIMADIKDEVTKAREEAEAKVAEIHCKHNMMVVNDIKVSKIYPNNIKELAPVAVEQVWKQQQFNLPARASEKEQAEALEALRKAAEGVEFQPNATSVVGYGPAEQRNMIWGAVPASTTD